MTWSLILSAAVLASAGDSAPVDLTHAVVLARGPAAPAAEQTAVTVLIEEVARRTGIRWRTVTDWPERAPVVVLTSSLDGVAWGQAAPPALRAAANGAPPNADASREGYRLLAATAADRPPAVWIVGASPRGALFGVGHLLRSLAMAPGSVRLDQPLDVTASPAYRLRGHQLGYRNRSNSYDAWDPKQYEQYIRELALFGTNGIENIPFEDAGPSPHMRVPRSEMNLRISEICSRYDLEYWVWTPATIDLNDVAARRDLLEQHEELYRTCPRLDGVFVPGGDPGNNHPQLVMPLLQDLAERLARHHPHARVWLSMQGFNAERVDWVYEYLDQHKPQWFGGIVHGPSSPDLKETRRRLAGQYAVRHYPDITHTVRCQYPVPWWDPAWAATLGREPINPRPLDEAIIHNYFAPYTAGFITYSDGVHDDVNKVIWSRLGWDPAADVRDVLAEYTRFFFGPDVAADAANGILALERNWQGALAANGGVDATLSHWQRLESQAPHLAANWRWQQCLLRAHYDAYTRHRLIYEARLETEANAALSTAATRGADTATDAALAVLQQADTDRVRPDLRRRIEGLGEALFQSIGLQTSVPRYGASGAERGAVLDFLDYPLNNRWWLEDEFAAIRKLPNESDKLARLELIRTWEQPGPGSFYDDVGNVAKSLHMMRGESLATDPLMIRNPNPGYWEGGRKRARQSWFSNMDWPIGMRYEGLDPAARYVVRTTGFRDCLLRIDGERVEPTLDGKDIGEFKEFAVPQEQLADGELLLTFDVPHEPELNWRVQSRLTELWLLRIKK
jgi:hypothetical protein